MVIGNVYASSRDIVDGHGERIVCGTDGMIGQDAGVHCSTVTKGGDSKRPVKELKQGLMKRRSLYNGRRRASLFIYHRAGEH